MYKNFTVCRKACGICYITKKLYLVFTESLKNVENCNMYIGINKYMDKLWYSVVANYILLIKKNSQEKNIS